MLARPGGVLALKDRWRYHGCGEGRGSSSFLLHCENVSMTTLNVSVNRCGVDVGGCCTIWLCCVLCNGLSWYALINGLLWNNSAHRCAEVFILSCQVMQEIGRRGFSYCKWANTCSRSEIKFNLLSYRLDFLSQFLTLWVWQLVTKPPSVTVVYLFRVTALHYFLLSTSHHAMGAPLWLHLLDYV